IQPTGPFHEVKQTIAAPAIGIKKAAHHAGHLDRILAKINFSLALSYRRRIYLGRTVSVIKTSLEKHPWYADRWRDDVEKTPEPQREMLFMLAARWADDIRMQAKLQREVKWHYINFPFKPGGETEDIKPLPPDPDNILSALEENRRIVKSQVSENQRAIALAWLFHLV